MFRRLSLTVRLTLFFTVLAVVIVMGLGALFMALADRHFVELDGMALKDKRAMITHVLEDAPDAATAREKLARALAHQSAVQVLVRESDGRVLYQSKAWPAHAEHTVHAPSHGLNFGVSTPALGAQALQVDVLLDTAFHVEFLQQLKRSLAWYATAVMIVAGLLAWLAAHQGLAPLRAMKRRAADVSAQRLDALMPEAAVPVEMADLAAELNRMLLRLRDDFRRLSEFSSDLAHELRTPISNLLTQTQVTLSARRDEATYRDTLASNAEELERLARMVSDMLFLAKTEHGVDLPNKERFSAAAEVRALVEFHGLVADERQLKIETLGEATILGDRLMFRRALSNALSNALRHATTGSTVTLRSEASPDGAAISVENHGPDIAPEILARLFDRFYSADPARSHPASSGSGLGLAIMRAIVNAHGGDVTVKSEAGTTVFTLYFPKAMP